MALLVVAYTVSTMRTERFWRDDVTYFAECVRVQPTDLDYRLRLHAALNKAGDHEGALAQLQRDVQMYPDNAYLRLMISQQYHMMGRDSDFMREFQKYSELTAAMARADLGSGRRRIGRRRRTMTQTDIVASRGSSRESSRFGRGVGTERASGRDPCRRFCW